jgi:hypothetical protein
MPPFDNRPPPPPSRWDRIAYALCAVMIWLALLYEILT